MVYLPSNWASQSSRAINRRGDTLNNPTLTIELESPSDDILLLKSTHWKAQKSVSIGPHYELYPDGVVSGWNIDHWHSLDVILTHKKPAGESQPRRDREDCVIALNLNRLAQS